MQLAQAQDSLFADVVSGINSLPVEKREEDLTNYMNWFEDQLLAAPEKLELQIDHDVRDGVYTRIMHAPAGTHIAGYKHKKWSLTFLLEGEISVLTREGTARIKAPLMFWSAPGIRRIGFTHSDVKWMTVNAVTSTDLEDIENELFSMDD